MTLTNLGGAPVNAQISFFANDGSALSIPLSFPGSNTASTLNSTANLTIAAYGSVVIQTASPASTLIVGWADVTAPALLEGYAVFSSAATGSISAGTVLLDARLNTSFVLPYDNTNGSRTGVAIANLSPNPTGVTAVLLDQNGTQIASTQIALQLLGQTAFFVNDIFPQAVNGRGLITFQSRSSFVTGLGLLFYPGGSFTSLPIIQ